MKKVGIIFVIAVMFLCGCSGNMKAGKAYLNEEKYAEAKAAFEKEVQAEKHLKEAYYGLGMACFELEEYEAAVGNFEKAVLFGMKRDPVFCSFLAGSYMETERYEAAILEYKNAIFDEDITEELKQEARYNMIIAYEKIGDWDKAKKELKNYTKDYPDDMRIKRDADFLETR